MFRRTLVCLCGLLALAAAPWAQAETIEGYFEGLVWPSGSPGPGNYATGAVGMTGWVVATTGVAKVVVQVDGVDIEQAHYGGPRPDVTRVINPSYPDALAPGFGYHLNTTRFPNFQHRISVKVYTFGGSIVDLPQVYTVNFNNNPSILRPFGGIDYPQRNQELYGTCDLNSPNPIYTPVTGWALDLGVEIGDAGVGYVELLLDGTILYNTRTDCFFDHETGGLTNCYGIPRQDIEVRYPYAINAPAAGFRFVLDIGFLLNVGYSQGGGHVLTIRSGDILTNVENVAEIPVGLYCRENLPDEGSFGVIETPLTDRPYEDTIVMQGWALDEDGIGAVEIWVDGIFFGNASYGVDSRPGVAAEYPGYPDVLAPVWRFLWDSHDLADGLRQMQVYAYDIYGNRTLIGERSFTVDNVVH